MAELTGPWLGSYWDREAPIRFEATFVQAQNSLIGRIMDDSPLGEAQIQGQVTGRQVTFTKKYFNNPTYTIQYQGTVSEDGDHIHGQWRIDNRHNGAWEAHRSDNDLSKELNALLAKSLPELTGSKT
ncbi:hypothetical protein [Leptothoe sp. PORK10 BA2]|uniref:hypothetical protein n=1 Tax=Leptothoe sp. PORK10 BA2 TaxID=3110254 RepID=UPI002B1FE7A5|nr:hypothetical protein [Leptothoe sp. PORK10 BA2]MEA5465587.1 hypothetical protein [Leptothoe sp. PORK10 BA2]